MAEYPTYGFQDELQSRSSAEVVIEATIIVIITTTALFGNTMVCWAVFRNKRLRTIPNIYVTSLAISDMLMATIVMPVSIEVLVTSKFIKSFSFCQLQGFSAFFSGITSVQIMAAMAVNRYYCVVKPSKYRKYFTVRRTIASVVIIILLAAFGGGFHLVSGWAIHVIHYGKVTCFTTYKSPEHEKYIVLLLNCSIMVPACVISVCYLKVFRHVRNHQKTAFKNRKQPIYREKPSAERTTEEEQQEQQEQPTQLQASAQGVQITKPSPVIQREDEIQENQQGNPPELQTSAQGVQITKPSPVTQREDEAQENQSKKPPKLQINVEEVKITRTLFATVLGYMACWIPVAIIDTIEYLSSGTLHIPRQVFLVWVYLAHGSSSINPFIYGALNRSFRNEFRSILRLKTRNRIDPVPQAVRFRRNAVSAPQT